MSITYKVGYHIEKDPVKVLTAALLSTCKLLPTASRPFFETLDDPRSRPRDVVAAFEEAKALIPRILTNSSDIKTITLEADYFLRLVAYIVSEVGSSLGREVAPRAASCAKVVIGLFHGTPKTTPFALESNLWTTLSAVAPGVGSVQSTHTCRACNQPLGQGTVTLYRSSEFHPACFVCHSCKSPTLNSFSDTNGVIACERCSK